MLVGEEARPLSLRVLQNFVRETGGKWDQEDWRQLVDDNRERRLAGDNSVGLPAPAQPQSIFAPGPGEAALDTGPLSGPLAEKPKATDDVVVPEVGTISETETVGAQAEAFGLAPVPAAEPDSLEL